MERLDEVMTAAPVMVDAATSVQEAAAMMRDADIGDVIVAEGGRLCGILTDRDIVVRAVAMGQNPADVRVADICSSSVTALPADASVDDAIRVMREMAVRRLPVTQDGQAVGIVSLGDLAIDRDPTSALADISGALPNQ